LQSKFSPLMIVQYRDCFSAADRDAIMELKELACKNCGAPLKADQFVEQLAMVRCSHCHAVFTLESVLPPNTANRPFAPRPKIELPKGMHVEDLVTTLEIRRRWFNPMYVFLLFFCVFWNGFMIVWHTIAISTGAWFMSVFGLLHTAVGLGIGYCTLAGFLNTTTIRIGYGMLEVHSGPVPWGGNLSIPYDEIEQIYCEEKVHHGKNGTSRTYNVMAVCRNKEIKTLLSGLTDAEQAMYLEQELERFLRITDRAVPGELPR
jgi:hypothetical protein